jgi:hypothetical protein
MLLPSKKYFLIVKKYIISHQILSILHAPKDKSIFHGKILCYAASEDVHMIFSFEIFRHSKYIKHVF